MESHKDEGTDGVNETKQGAHNVEMPGCAGWFNYSFHLSDTSNID